MLQSAMEKHARINRLIHGGSPAALVIRRSCRSRCRKSFPATVRILAHRIAVGAWHSVRHPVIAVALACVGFAAVADAPPALAQVAAANRPATPAVVPSFWDPRPRPERPDLARL